MPNGSKKISYEDYKNFSKDEKNLYQFTAYNKIHDFHTIFAKKWVEKVLIWGGITIGGVFLVSLANVVIASGV